MRIATGCSQEIGVSGTQSVVSGSTSMHSGAYKGILMWTCKKGLHMSQHVNCFSMLDDYGQHMEDQDNAMFSLFPMNA